MTLVVEPRIMGREEPRLWTRPLRPLTPATSLGFEAIDFAERVCLLTLLPWQRWWLIHALELKVDGSFRFRIILTLISRQNGKTFLLKVLALYFMYLLRVRTVLSTAQKLDVARESWNGTYEIAAAIPAMAAEFEPNPRGKPGRRDGNGYEEIRLNDGRRYRVTALHQGSGRGWTVQLLIVDELREQRDTIAWAAVSKTTIAQPNSLIVPISNAGDDESIVLNTLRAAALADNPDPALGMFEWSASDGSAIDDVEAWQQANPALGHTLTVEALRLALATDTPEVFRTECMCQHVRALDVLVNPDAWLACADPMLTLDGVRDRVVACFEVAPDGAHAVLVAAARFDDGRIGLDVVKAWSDLNLAKRDLPDLLDRVKAVSLGWFPSGPAAELGYILRAQRGSHEITGGSVTEACQAYVGAIHRGMVRHRNDPLLSTHTVSARKFQVSDGYRFTRKGGHVDAAYAAAGALMLAASAPVRVGSGVWVV